MQLFNMIKILAALGKFAVKLCTSSISTYINIHVHI